MSLTWKRKYSKSQILHERLIRVHSQNKPRLHFGMRDTLQQCRVALEKECDCDSQKSWLVYGGNRSWYIILVRLLLAVPYTNQSQANNTYFNLHVIPYLCLTQTVNSWDPSPPPPAPTPPTPPPPPPHPQPQTHTHTFNTNIIATIWCFLAIHQIGQSCNNCALLKLSWTTEGDGGISQSIELGISLHSGFIHTI